MSHLKILVCSFLLAAAVSASSTVNADHRYAGTQSAGCGRTSGYGSGAGRYGMNVYSPNSSSNGYQSQWNSGYGANQRFNNGHNSPGYSGTTYNRDQYSRPQNSGYYRNDREAAWGRDSYSYGTSNSNTGANSVYDSAHGDYHAVPVRRNQPTYDSYQNVSPYPHNGHGVNVNNGW